MGGSSSRRCWKCGSAAASTTSPTPCRASGLRTGWVGGLNSSPMGAIIRNHARAVGMDVSYVVERKYDGVGKKDRIGLNFTEVGVAKRGSVTLYDRGHTATSRHEAGRRQLEKALQRRRRPLAPHRRDLLGSVRIARARSSPKR